MPCATFRWLDHRCTLQAEPGLLGEVLALLPAFAPELHEGEADAPSADLVAGPEDDPDTLEYAVVRALLGMDRSHLHLHAAAAEIAPGHALLVLGPSGAGKSTMARAFMAAGHRIYGDDVVALGSEGLVAFPRMVKVDADRTLLDPAPGGWWADTPAEVMAIVRAEWRAESQPVLRSMDTATALRHLLDATHSTTHDPEAHLDALTEVAATAPAAALRYGEASDALGTIAEWLGRADTVDPALPPSDH